MAPPPPPPPPGGLARERKREYKGSRKLPKTLEWIAICCLHIVSGPLIRSLHPDST